MDCRKREEQISMLLDGELESVGIGRASGAHRSMQNLPLAPSANDRSER